MGYLDDIMWYMYVFCVLFMYFLCTFCVLLDTFHVLYVYFSCSFNVLLMFFLCTLYLHFMYFLCTFYLLYMYFLPIFFYFLPLLSPFPPLLPSFYPLFPFPLPRPIPFYASRYFRPFCFINVDGQERRQVSRSVSNATEAQIACRLIEFLCRAFPFVNVRHIRGVNGE